jgi:PAS domain S-box-containing protein
MRETERNFKFLVESSADLICRFGLDRRATYVSPSCLRLLGWTVEEMVSFGPSDYIHPDDLEIVSAARQNALQSGDRASSPVVRIRRKEGSWIWMEINGSIVLDPNTGRPQEFVVMSSCGISPNASS